MNIFTALYKSFYDPFAYEIASKRWGVKIFLYYILLSLIFAVPIYYSSVEMVDYIFPKTQAEVDEFLSGVEIKDGKIVCNFDSPRYLLNSEGKKIAAISPRRLTPEESQGIIISLAGNVTEMHIPGFENVFDLKEENLLMFNKSFVKKTFIPASFFSSMFLVALYILIMTGACFVMSLANFPGLGIFGAIKFSTLAISPSILISFTTLILLQRPLDNFFVALITCGLIFYIFKKSASLGFDRNFTAPSGGSPEI